MRLNATGAQHKTYRAPLDVAHGLDASLSVQDVASLPRERFTPFSPKATHAISSEKPLWLRLQIEPGQGQARASHWFLEIPTVLVDRYEVYQRDASGAWQMAVAGDRVAYEQWPVRSLRPRFPLQATSSDLQDVYIRVLHQLPATIQPMIVHSDAAAERDVSAVL